MKKRILKVLGLLIILALLGGVGFLAKDYLDKRSANRDLSSQLDSVKKELEAYKADPNQAAKAEVTRVVGEVGKLYALPKDEEPSVATVKDKAKLKDQPFFAKAENGDVTLIYSNAKLAVLYRPSTNKIINVSSVTIQDPQQTPTPTPTPTP